MSTEKEAGTAGVAERLRGWFLGRLPDGWFEGEPEIIVDREEITVIGRLSSPGTGENGAEPPSTAASLAPGPEAGLAPGQEAGQGADRAGVAGGPADAKAGPAGGPADAEAGPAGGPAGPGGGPAGGPGEPGDGEAAQEAGAPAAAGAPGGGAGDAAAVAAALGRARRFREETRDARIEIAREVEQAFGRKVSWGVICGERKVMFTTLSVPVMTRLRQAERRVLDTLVDAGVARSRSDALAWCVRLVGEHEDSWLTELRGALRRVEQVRAAGPRA